MIHYHRCTLGHVKDCEETLPCSLPDCYAEEDIGLECRPCQQSMDFDADAYDVEMDRQVARELERRREETNT